MSGDAGRTGAEAPEGFVDFDQLRPGDLLLSMGVGPLSEHIRAVAGGSFSHVALAIGSSSLIESTTPVVRQVTLTESLNHPRQSMRAYRHLDSNGGIPAACDKARTYLGRTYSFVDLVYAYLRILSQAPQGPGAPLLIRMIDSYLNAERADERVTCSELVVRSYHAAGLDVRVPLDWKPGVSAQEVVRFWLKYGRQALTALSSEETPMLPADTELRELLRDDRLPPPIELEAFLSPLDQNEELAELETLDTHPEQKIAELTRKLLARQPQLNEGIPNGSDAYRSVSDALHLVTPFQLESSPSFKLLGDVDVTKGATPARAGRSTPREPLESPNRLGRKLALLRSYNASLRGKEEASFDLESLEVGRPPEAAFALESIILRRRRPVLAIQEGTATLEFRDAEDSVIWGARLAQAKDLLGPVIAAVGRIDLRNNPDYSWVGTGWLVDRNVIVTNRHVAEAFARFDGETFVFQAGVDGDMRADIDFLQEIGRDEKQLFEIKRVLHIEPKPGADLAFLEVDQQSGRLAKPIRLSSLDPGALPDVATIGYPAFDSRIPEPDLMEEIYGKVYDKKRLAPGAITGVDDTSVHHNCTTLGGNSGSVVVDLATGEALGLHFSGSFLRTNYAVRADVVEERLDALRSGRLRPPIERPRKPSSPRRPAAATLQNPTSRVVASPVGGGSISLNVPLVITVSLGEVGQPATGRPLVHAYQPVLPIDGATDDDRDIEPEGKARPEDYADRQGYLADFLDPAIEVPLPTVIRGAGDVLSIGGEKELRYEHFSVIYNKRRRMCFLSACNVDGARSKSSKRTSWRFDPRIPTELQIMKECYGNSPKFSRGHMTRREDPAWGSARAIQRGSDDSMHVTNATPQMQAFNSPIWLALEDYALQHAREDDMRISVFTGPYFSKSDPTMYGVRIPLEFWKVIAFLHDETGELCATGYEMSQADNLTDSEFVFGQFRSPQLNLATQVSIASISAKAGISFHDLPDVDPFGQESVDGAPTRLLALDQIRFV